MSKEVDKSGESGGSKSITGYRNKDLFKRRFYMNVAIMCRALRQKLLGHYLYYGMSGNTRGIKSYYYHTVRLAFKWINRQSQKKSYNWTQFNHFLVAHIDSGPAVTLTNNVIATGTPKDSMCGHTNDTVTYCYNVTNTGNVSLTNVTLNDIIATVNATDPLGESVTDDDDCTINITHISLPAWWKGSEERER